MIDDERSDGQRRLERAQNLRHEFCGYSRHPLAAKLVPGCCEHLDISWYLSPTTHHSS
jgi:hypothetical protein